MYLASWRTTAAHAGAARARSRRRCRRVGGPRPCRRRASLAAERAHTISCLPCPALPCFRTPLPRLTKLLLLLLILLPFAADPLTRSLARSLPPSLRLCRCVWCVRVWRTDSPLAHRWTALCGWPRLETGPNLLSSPRCLFAHCSLCFRKFSFVCCAFVCCLALAQTPTYVPADVHSPLPYKHRHLSM